MSQPSKVQIQQPPPILDQSVTEPPGHLFHQLGLLSDWANDRTALDNKLANPKERKKCMDLVQNFYEHVIHSFPSPGEYPWSAIHEKIRLIEASFDVFARVGTAFCAEKDFASFSKQFFVRVFNICRVLDYWIDVPNVSVPPGYPTPRELHAKGERACIGLLRAWFGCLQVEDSGLCGWQAAKEIVVECLSTTAPLSRTADRARFTSDVRHEGDRKN